MPTWQIQDLIKFHERKRKNRDRPAWQTGNLEPPAGNASDATLPIPEIVTGKITVCCECWRIRLADADGISVKGLLDALCDLRDPENPDWRLIPGDKARDINVKIIQRHCTKGQPEKVIITIQPKEQNDTRQNDERLGNATAIQRAEAFIRTIRESQQSNKRTK